MSIMLAHRLRGVHALLEMALNEASSRPRPDERTVAGIRKKKLIIKDRLARGDVGQAVFAAR